MIYMYVDKFQILFECVRNERKVKCSSHTLEFFFKFLSSPILAMKRPRET